MSGAAKPTSASTLNGSQLGDDAAIAALAERSKGEFTRDNSTLGGGTGAGGDLTVLDVWAKMLAVSPAPASLTARTVIAYELPAARDARR